MRRLLWSVAVVLLANAAAADEGPVGRTDIRDDLLAYYGSERTTGLLFGAVGVGSAAVGGVLVTRETDFARGLGWSMLSLGALEILGGGFYVLQVGGEIDHYTRVLAADPAGYKKEEAAHIHGTTSRFVFYRVAELVVAAGGVAAATYGFASNRDAWKGAGIGVAAEALTLFVLDAYGQTRATRYENQVLRFEPTLALSPPTAGSRWGACLSGRF